MLKNFNSINNQYMFNKAYIININKNNYPDLTKYLLSTNHDFMFGPLQYFDFEKRILRSSFKSELAINFPTISKFKSCHIFFNYASTKKTHSARLPYLLAPKRQKPNTKSFETITTVKKIKQWFNFEFKNKHQTLKKQRLFLSDVTSNKDQSIEQTKSLEITKWQNPHLMSADWILENLIQQLNSRISPRSTINNLIRSTGTFIRLMGSNCPVLGLRVVATGRLGSQKKGMAQQIIRAIGKVPLTTLRQKIDYCQGFVRTRRGLIGIKVWVCYK
jgi:Ribosomal protein S3, C-terminal domain